MSTFFEKAVSLKREMAAYETIWGMKDATQKSIAELFQRYQALPSQVLEVIKQDQMFVDELHKTVQSFLATLSGFSVGVHGAFQYPSRLRSAAYPLELFYYRGDIGLTESRCISVVGARKASEPGKKRATRLSRELVSEGFTIVSGLAQGIDTAAMTAAMEAKGRTIGVIGTPINQYYPKENKGLQDSVAQRHLLVSQVPFYRYAQQPFRTKKYYFPERNVTMSALAEATVIVEASDTSGSLTQARAALAQGRKVMILNSCFENKEITWPAYYEKRGAIRVRTTQDILAALQ